jgi:hypothetical protein
MTKDDGNQVDVPIAAVDRRDDATPGREASSDAEAMGHRSPTAEGIVTGRSIAETLDGSPRSDWSRTRSESDFRRAGRSPDETEAVQSGEVESFDAEMVIEDVRAERESPSDSGPRESDVEASAVGATNDFATPDGGLLPAADSDVSDVSHEVTASAPVQQASKNGGETADTSATAEAAEPRRMTAEEYRLARLFGSLPREGAGWVRGNGTDTCPPGYSINVAGGQSYADTIPEICFASPDDAVSAGFRARKGDPEFVPSPPFDEGD